MTSSIPDPVAALLDATNAGDLDGFLDSFTADGAVDDWGRVFAGRAAIKGWSDDEYIGKNMTLAVTSTMSSADGVVVIADVGGDGFNGPSTFTFTVKGDKVARMEIRE